MFEELETRGKQELREQGCSDERMEFVREYDARYRGQSFELDVPHAPDIAAVEQRFHQRHKSRYGYDVTDEPVEIVNVRLTAIAALEPAAEPSADAGRGSRSLQSEQREVWIDGAFSATPVYGRDTLPAGATISGPALIEQYDACTYVPPRWKARCEPHMLIVERTDG